MKILLAEDNPNKAESLSKALEDIRPGCSVSRASSIRSARRKLRQENFDLLVLDMTLPVYDAGARDILGDAEISLGGEIVLRDILESKKYVPTIVVTQFDIFDGFERTFSVAEISPMLRKDFGPMFLGLVRFEAGSQRWKVELETMLSRIGG